jgi:hypothetical protein
MRSAPVISLFAIATLAVAILSSCSPVRHVRPLDKGELTATASLGGPFAGQLGWAPFPMLSLGANYGVLDRFDVEAGWIVTSALFGVCELDGGCNWRPIVPFGARPGLILSPKLLGTTDFRKGNSRLWPGAGVTALWQLHKRSFGYIGMDNWFETHAIRYDGNQQAYHWLPLLFIGADYGGSVWQWQLEARWFVPNIDPTRSPSNPVQTVGINGYGGIGAFFGVSRSFGKIRNVGGEK